MMPENTYAAIDIGETYAKLVIGTVYKEQFKLCGAFMTPSSGINNGEVNSRGEIQKTVLELLDKAQKVGFGITKLIVVLPSTNLDIHRRKAKSNVLSSSQIINEKDLDTLKRATADYQLGSNEMVVGIYPIMYYLDGATVGREDPIGMKMLNSIQLDAFVISLPQLLARPIVDAIQDMEIELLDVIPAPMALANAITTVAERQNGVTVVDIGGKYNNASLFYRNLFCAYKQGTCGGSIISKQLQDSLKADKQQAELVKKKYGSALASEASDLGVYYNKETGDTVKEKSIVEVVEENIATIAAEIKSNVELLSKTAMQGTIVIAGGVSNTVDIKQKLSESLGRDVNVRRLDVIGATDASFYPGIGAIMYYIREHGKKIEVDLIND